MDRSIAATPTQGPDVPQGLRQVLLYCAARRIAITDLRRHALQVLWTQPRPVSAYQVIALLERETGRRLKPPSIYRILDFLVENGLAARIESRNAYVACANPERPWTGVFLLCDCCDRSVEMPIPALFRAIEMDTAAIGFAVTRPVMEMHGTCAGCRDAGATMQR